MFVKFSEELDLFGSINIERGEIDGEQRGFPLFLFSEPHDDALVDVVT